jgi:hypothetical protein
LKVPRQCPLVFLVDVSLREGKAVGSEKGKVLGSGLCYEQGKETAWALLCVMGINFDFNITRAASE